MTREHGRGWARIVVPIAAWGCLFASSASLTVRAEATEDGRGSVARPVAASGTVRDAAPKSPPALRPVEGERATRPAIVYVPPARGRARHTAGGGTRGIVPAGGEAGSAGRPQVSVLAPSSHVGLTASPAPTLYWTLSAPTSKPIELTLIDDEAIDPLVKLSLPGPVAPGVHSLALDSLGVELAPGKTYRWFVALVHDPHRRSRDALAEGAIERILPEAEEAGTEWQQPDASIETLRQAARVHAEQGRWYDALAAIAAALERDPANEGIRTEHDALLEQLEGESTRR